MSNPNQLARIGQLIGEPSRAAIITALMDGRALTAKELASCANVTPQTASTHIAQLASANLLTVEKQGRHKYHRLASAEIAQMIEGIMEIALQNNTPVSKRLSTGPKDKALRNARTCYDHFAGRLGVSITDALLAQGHIEFDDEAGLITEQGEAFFQRSGIALEVGRGKSRRPICRPCLDWTERRRHIGGKLGAAICYHFLERNFVRRLKESRAVEVTPAGRQALKNLFDIREI